MSSVVWYFYLYAGASVATVAAMVMTLFAVRRYRLAHRDAMRQLHEASESRVPLLPASPYRSPPDPLPAVAETQAEDELQASKIAAILERKPWRRVARDNDNRPPWDYACGDFYLSPDELRLKGTPLPFSKKWVRAWRERLEGEMSGKLLGPTRDALLSQAMAAAESLDQEEEQT